MSIGVGTLQPKTRIMHPVWLAGLIGFALALTLAVIVSNYEEPAAGSATTVAGRPLVNTPSELRGGLATTANAGTLANTPTELRGGSFAGTFGAELPAIVPHVPRRTAEAASFGVTLGTTTPSELRGASFEAPSSAYEPIIVNGTVCGQCR